jgi:hypothetical protein
MAVVAVSAVALAPLVACLRRPGWGSFVLVVLLDLVALPGALSYGIESRVKQPARRRELLLLVWCAAAAPLALPCLAVGTLVLFVVGSEILKILIIH